MTKSTLTKTKPSRNGDASFDGDEDIGCERAAIFASVSPLSIVAMGTFPFSLIAWSRSRRRHFDDALTLRPKRNLIHVAGELESPQQIAVNVRADSLETAIPGGRTHPLPTVWRLPQLSRTFGKSSNLKTDMAAKIAGTLFLLLVLFLTIPALIVRESREAAWAFGALMGAFGAGAFLVLVVVKSLKEKLAEGPQDKKRKELITLWRLHEIGKGRMDWRSALKIVPSHTDLEALLAEMKAEAETAAARTPGSIFAPPPPAAMPKLKPLPEILDTLRIVFQDGEEMDIHSDWGFVRLDEEEFKIAYKAFEKARAEIYGLPKPPELNSKFQQNADRMWDKRSDDKDEDSK